LEGARPRGWILTASHKQLAPDRGRAMQQARRDAVEGVSRGRGQQLSDGHLAAQHQIDSLPLALDAVPHPALQDPVTPRRVGSRRHAEGAELDTSDRLPLEGLGHRVQRRRFTDPAGAVGRDHRDPCGGVGSRTPPR
jgi:hypothetical protein